MLISKEWYESQRELFVSWYCSLGTGLTTSLTQKQAIPELPEASVKVGVFIRTAMENLAQSGFEFSDDQMKVLCTENSMNKVVGMQRNLPFFKLFDPDDSNGHLINGRPRFYAKPLTFGKYTVYLNSQIYETDREPFIAWYNGLSSHAEWK